MQNMMFSKKFIFKKWKGHMPRQHKGDNVQLRNKNKELNCLINILKKRLSYSKDILVYICYYQCNFESGGMEEIKDS